MVVEIHSLVPKNHSLARRLKTERARVVISLFFRSSEMPCGGGILKIPLFFLCLLFTVLFLSLYWIADESWWDVFLWEVLVGTGLGLEWYWHWHWRM
jgi:hypothetical protein